MRLQNPFAALSPTGLDSQVLLVPARVDAELTVLRIHALIPEEGSLPGIRIAAKRLADQGVLNQRVIPRVHLYALNREHRLVEFICAIADTRQGLIDRIRAMISAWCLQPSTAKLFGSAARNDMRSDSDIDLLFVFRDGVEEEGLDLSGALADTIRAWTGNDVRPLVY